MAFLESEGGSLINQHTRGTRRERVLDQWQGSRLCPNHRESFVRTRARWSSGLRLMWLRVWHGLLVRLLGLLPLQALCNLGQVMEPLCVSFSQFIKGEK